MDTILADQTETDSLGEATGTPEDFFVPGYDAGLWLVRPETLAPRLVAKADIRKLVLGSWVRHRMQTDDHFTTIIRKETWSQSAIFPTVAALAENVVFANRSLTVNGKFLLNAAAGGRIRQRYRKKMIRKGHPGGDGEVSQYLAGKRLEAKALSVTTAADWRDLPLVLETRNFYNYYHFTKETLPYLTLYARYGLQGEIHIVGPESSERDFVRQELDTWFPELAGRIRLVKGRATYQRALLALDVKSLYTLTGKAVIPDIVTSPQSAVNRRPSITGFFNMSMNCAEGALVDLHTACHAALPPPPAARRRLYVARRSDRVRTVKNEKKLLRKLSAIGFETIYFEDYDVMEQAKLMRAAEAVIMPHGAGLTNMIFVRPGTHVFEISNLQTLQKRYGSFNPLALVSGAIYHHIFLDHDWPDKTVIPHMERDGHCGVDMSDFEADAIVSAVCAQLEPEACATGFQTCKALNDAGQFADLAKALQIYAVCLAHLADFHVWSANTASNADDRATALRHLRRAMVLGPDRVPLLKRVLVLARALGDDAAFHEAAALYADTAPGQMRAFFMAQDWPVPEGDMPLALSVF